MCPLLVTSVISFRHLRLPPLYQQKKHDLWKGVCEGLEQSEAISLRLNAFDSNLAETTAFILLPMTSKCIALFRKLYFIKGLSYDGRGSYFAISFKVALIANCK